MSDHTWKSTTVTIIPLMRFSSYDDELGEHCPLTLRADRIESYEAFGKNRVYVLMDSGAKHLFDTSYEEFHKRYVAVMKGKAEEGES